MISQYLTRFLRWFKRKPIPPLPAEPDQLRRELLRRGLHAELEHTLEQRVERYLAIQHQPVVGKHHFAAASTECISIYRDGYFISAVMTSHAVMEGIWKFVLERNKIARGADIPTEATGLVASGLISQSCADAVIRIYGSYRNDVHHMNPGVAAINFEDLAPKNLNDLAILEREVFGVTMPDGRLIPNQPLYWDVAADGTVPVYFRFG